eukprot:Em0020g889a
MAQRGILSYFTKSVKSASSNESVSPVVPQRTSKRESDSPKSAGDQKPAKRASKSQDDNDGLPQENSDSPVLKRRSQKGRRVLQDSDSEGDTEKNQKAKVNGDGHHMELHGNIEEKEAREAVDVLKEGKGDKEERGKSCGQKRQREREDEDESSYELQGNREIEEERAEGCDGKAEEDDSGVVGPTLGNHGVPITPPKRQTARKHTGKVAQKEVDGVNGRPAKKLKLEQEEEEKDVEDKGKKVKVGEKIAKKEKAGEEKVKAGEEKAKKKKAGEETAKKVKAGEEKAKKEKTVEETANNENAGEQKKVEEMEDDLDHGVSDEEAMEISEEQPSKDECTMKTSEAKQSPKGAMLSFFAPRTVHKTTSSTKTTPSSTSELDVKISSATESSSGASSGGSKTAVADSLYDPSKQDYHPVDDACWQRGQKVPYGAIARTFEKIEEESKRLKIISVLTNFLRSVIALTPDDLLPSVYLCLNKVGPAYEGSELGVGESLLMKAIASATGRQLQHIKADAVEKGDLGIVAEQSRSNQKMMFAPPRLTISGVFAKLKEIASMAGNASMAKKVDIVKAMFVACKHSEARYLIRSLGGKLRIGLAEQSVLTAVAHAAVYTPPGQSWPLEILDASKLTGSAEKFQKQLDEGAAVLKTTYCEHPNYDTIILAMIRYGIQALPEHCKLTAGIPLKPMLAHPTKGIQEVLSRFENAEVTSEWKYDGERAQIHILDDGTVKIYSRNSEDNTSKYPDIIARVPKIAKDLVRSCVLDTEAVAWDMEKKQILPFQTLSTRKRKNNAFA